MDADEQLFDLEAFVWHLAAHLCGVQAIREKKSFRLKWRSPILLVEAAADSMSASGDEERCAFVDAIFEFAWKHGDEAEKTKDPEEDSVTNRPLIQMHWGSLWIQPGGGARYYTTKSLSIQDLTEHFAAPPLHCDLETGAVMLAKQMAVALQNLSPASAAQEKDKDASNAVSTSLSILLSYPEISETMAPLKIANSGSNSSPVDESLLDSMLLFPSHQPAPPPGEEDLGKLATYMEKEWRPSVCESNSGPTKNRNTAPVSAAAVVPAENKNPDKETKKTQPAVKAKKKKVVLSVGMTTMGKKKKRKGGGGLLGSGK